MKYRFISSAIFYSFFVLSSFQVHSSDFKSAVWEVRGKFMSGTGFFIDETHFVTAFHVVESIFRSKNRTKFEKKFSDFLIKTNLKQPDIFLSQENNPNILKVKRIAGLSYIYDLAILEIEGETSHYLNLGDIQFKNLEAPTLLDYTKKWTEVKIQPFLIDQIFSYLIVSPHFESLKGMSGGPLINDKGQVVAVFTGTKEMMSITAVKTHYLKKMIKDIHRRRSESLDILSPAIDSVFLREKKQFYDRALKGDPLYQYVLANKFYVKDEKSFFLSLMGETDSDKARFYWLEKAAGSLAVAQYELAFDLYIGRAGRFDFAKSIYWMRKAAEQNYAPAQYLIAFTYQREKDQNLNQIFYWMKESAKQAYAPARYYLALMYKKGEAVKQDLKQSFYWMKESAKQAYAPAQHELGLMYKNGEGVKQDLKQSFYWMKESAEQNNIEAQYELALMYKKNEGVKQDFLLANYWFEKVAKGGNYLALYELAKIHSQGKEKDLKLAAQFFIKAEEEKNATPFEKISGLLNFQDHKEDKTKIFETVLNLSKTSIHVVSQYRLAQMYAKGDGTQIQLQLAFKGMKKSAEQGYTPAQYELSQMYNKGKGTVSHPQLSSYWLKKASLGKHPLAMEKLGCHSVFSPKSTKQ